MIPAIVVFVYLAIILYVGMFAFRKGTGSKEDFFLASRSLGPWVFLLTVFVTNMTAFAILGSSGLAYQRGIGAYGLMASSSGLIIPLTIFLIGTRLWSLGKKHGYMTQVQYFRDRWECDGIGTLIFAVTSLMMIPYVVIGMMGGGHTLDSLSDGWVPYWLGGAIVAIVVMLYVFFGGMRGVAWVNALQTVLFLCFGAIAFYLISRNLGGYDKIMAEIAADPEDSTLLSRARISPQEFFSYTFIPLSAMMFPHMAIMCLTAEKVTSFKRTVVWYPICILLIWLPSVYLGVIAAHQFPGLKLGESDDVILRLLSDNTDVVVAGILGAAIMACVMATDSQIMALSTMFSQDVFAHYGGVENLVRKPRSGWGGPLSSSSPLRATSSRWCWRDRNPSSTSPSASVSPASPRSRRSLAFNLTLSPRFRSPIQLHFEKQIAIRQDGLSGCDQFPQPGLGNGVLLHGTPVELNERLWIKRINQQKGVTKSGQDKNIV